MKKVSHQVSRVIDKRRVLAHRVPPEKRAVPENHLRCDAGRTGARGCRHAKRLFFVNQPLKMTVSQEMTGHVIGA